MGTERAQGVREGGLDRHNRVYVLGAFVCDEERPRESSVFGAPSDFAGVRDYLELPQSGPLRLRNSLILKLCRGLTLLPSAVGVPAQPLVGNLVVRLVGPKGQVAKPHTRVIRFDAQSVIVRESIQLQGIEISDFGIYGFEVSFAGAVLTIVPLMVGPCGVLKATVAN